MSGKSRTLRRVLLLALAVYLVCSVAAVQVMNAALFGRADEPDGLTVRYADVAADYPRQTVTFSSGSAQLTGWLYPAEDAAALVVIAHGLGADAEVYLPETMHFVDEGYSVLTYDATGTGASGGSGTRGLAQSALDLDAALTRAEQEDLPILLFGHSWGGYAAAAVLGGASLAGGKGSYFGSIAGAMILSLIVGLLIFWKISSYYQNLVQGIILILALSVGFLSLFFKQKRERAKVIAEEGRN